MKERADKLLVYLGLARSRSHAQDLIKRKLVKYQGEFVAKTGALISEEGIEVLEKESFVGRGGSKLDGFLQVHPIDFSNKLVADIGASTGGFTQVALKYGAQKVFAVDVGHDQLAESLVTDSRVINLEGLNVKEAFEFSEEKKILVDIMLVDLSFISTSKVIPNIVQKLAMNGVAVILFKPQFEVGSKNLKINALADDLKVISEKMQCFLEVCKLYQLQLRHWEACTLKGKRTGNQEYFFYLQKTSAEFENKPIEFKELK